MEYPELSITVSSFNGDPLVAIKGTMDSWHASTVEDALHSFLDYGTKTMTLDLSDLKFSGMEGASALLRTFRMLRPEMRIHTVAHGHLSSLLHKAELGSCIKICSSLDEVAESVRPYPEYTTSRWMAYKNDDIELPLAA